MRLKEIAEDQQHINMEYFSSMKRAALFDAAGRRVRMGFDDYTDRQGPDLSKKELDLDGCTLHLASKKIQPFAPPFIITKLHGLNLTSFNVDDWSDILSPGLQILRLIACSTPDISGLQDKRLASIIIHPRTTSQVDGILRVFDYAEDVEVGMLAKLNGDYDTTIEFYRNSGEAHVNVQYNDAKTGELVHHKFDGIFELQEWLIDVKLDYLL